MMVQRPKAIIVRNNNQEIATLRPGDIFHYDDFLLPLKVLDGRTFEEIYFIAEGLDNGLAVKRSIKDDVSYEYIND